MEANGICVRRLVETELRAIEQYGVGVFGFFCAQHDDVAECPLLGGVPGQGRFQAGKRRQGGVLLAIGNRCFGRHISAGTQARVPFTLGHGGGGIGVICRQQ
ncbi:hypothetical protein D3C80_1424270 [compost metagenome]